MNIFETLFVQPILNILVVIYQGLTLLHIPYALGFSIILMTVFIRLLLYPLTRSQLKTSKKMQDLAPHLSKIKEKHKGDMKRQQEAQMALYKEHGVNPAAGCLPLLIQLPVFYGLYNVLTKISNPKSVAAINHFIYLDSMKLKHLWDAHFFGLPLGKTPSELFHTIGPVILLIPVITALFQFIQSKMMMPEVAPQKTVQNANQQEDFMATFQKQSLFIFPLMLGFISYTFSIGLSLYWNTFTLFGIIQQYKVSGLGSLGKWIKR